MSNKVYIVILNYDGWKDTIECLESVLKNDYENYQIIVVDNNSPNNSVEYIKNWTEGTQKVLYDKNSPLKYLSQPFDPKPLEYIHYTKKEALEGGNTELESKLNNPIIIIQAGENGGFASGNNIGIKYALKKNDFDNIWLLNNDTVIEKSSLTNLVKENADLTGSILLIYDRPDILQCVGGGSIRKYIGGIKMNYYGEKWKDIKNKVDQDKKLDFISGASLLIRKEVFDKIGLLPEEYFLYWEETDFCYKAKINKLSLLYSTTSIVYHKIGGTTDITSEFTDLLATKNFVIFFKKYLKYYLVVALPVLYIGKLINRIKRKEYRRVVSITKAMVEGLKH